MTVRSELFAVTTTGSAGSASGNTTTTNAIVGEILELKLNYHASAPAGTTDIVVDGNTTGIDIYAKTNSATDIRKPLGVYPVDSAATALTNCLTPFPIVVAEKVKVAIAQSDALTNCVTGTLTYRPLRAEVIGVTTTGNDGSASGNTTSGYVHGIVRGIVVNYDGTNAPNTTDLTVEMATSGVDLYAKANSATDVTVVPALYAVNSSNSAVDAGDVTPWNYCVADSIKVSLAQANAGTNTVVVTVLYDPDVHTTLFDVDCTGSDGSATGSVTVPVYGEILGILVDCHANTPATTDITITDNYTGTTIWSRTDSAADAYVVPAELPFGNTGAALTSAVIPSLGSVAGDVKVNVAQANAESSSVVVTMFTRR